MKILIGACVFFASLLPASGQSLIKLGEFTSYEQDAQFLPGGIVVVRNAIEDSQTKVYKYRSGKLVRIKDELPSSIKHWTSFNWYNIDDSDQTDLSIYLNTSEQSYLPAHSKVKALAEVPIVASGRVFELICYSVRSEDVSEQDNVSPNLHLLLMSRKEGPEFTYTPYTKHADLLVDEDVDFGALLLEPQPMGTFVAVYFADGGNHPTYSVAVYLLKPANSPHKRKEAKISKNAKMR
jgi:hypothetical protein